MTRFEVDTMTDSAVVLLSGGLDSTVALFWARKNFARVCCVAFDYGQRHRTELDAASFVANTTGVALDILSVRALSQIGGSDLVGAAYSSETLNALGANVPGRNLTFLTLAAVFANSHGISNVVLGVNADDFQDFTDCRKDFVIAAESALRLCISPRLRILTPWIELTKGQIVRAASDYIGCVELLPRTVSCYLGASGAGCGKCHACLTRARAILESEC